MYVVCVRVGVRELDFSSLCILKRKMGAFKEPDQRAFKSSSPSTMENTSGQANEILGSEATQFHPGLILPSCVTC